MKGAYSKKQGAFEEEGAFEYFHGKMPLQLAGSAKGAIKHQRRPVFGSRKTGGALGHLWNHDGKSKSRTAKGTKHECHHKQ
jgi:hypothetical protein